MAFNRNSSSSFSIQDHALAPFTDVWIGDFSFAHSLLKYYAHRFRTLTATTLEAKHDLLKKYPQAADYITDLLGANDLSKQERDTRRRDEDGQAGHTATAQSTIAALTRQMHGKDMIEKVEADTDEGTNCSAEDHFEGFSPPASPSSATPASADAPSETSPPQLQSQHTARIPPQLSPPQPCPPKYTVHYSIDATKLTTPSTYNALTRPLQCHTATRPPATPFQGFTTLIFNFPHTGGLSTDINRQVRHNQQMLHSFLSQGKALLERGVKIGRDARNKAGKEARARRQEDVPVSGKRGYGSSNSTRAGASAGAVAAETKPLPKSSRYDTDEEDTHSSADESDPSTARPVPKILITLFEGEPYTLWNIRDLARSVGLECRRSWRFDWSLWPGYRHARTLGNLEGKGGADPDAEAGEEKRELGCAGACGGSAAGKGRKKGKGPGWRGEEREARTYEFGLKNDGLTVTKGKRKRDGAQSDSEDD